MAGLTLESMLLAATLLVLIALLSVGLSIRPAAAIPLLLLVELAVSASVAPVIAAAGIRVGRDRSSLGDPCGRDPDAIAATVGLRPSRPLVLLFLVLGP